MKKIIASIILVMSLSIAQSQSKPFYCNDDCCSLCHVFISNVRDYDKLVYRVVRNKKDIKKNRKQEYCCFHISRDYTYPLISNQNPMGTCPYGFIVTNKNIIIDFLLPFFPDSIRNELLYSYNENRDTVFRNLIEYDNKVIVDNEVYYYPLKDTTLRYAVISTLHLDMLDEFIELLKKEDLFKDGCLIDLNTVSSIGIYIPLVERELTLHPSAKTKKEE